MRRSLPRLVRPRIVRGQRDPERYKSIHYKTKNRTCSEVPQLAEAAGVGRQSLYKALAYGAQPRYGTVLKLIRALGLQLAVRGVSVA